MSAERDRIIQTIESHFSKEKGLELCILYGSAAQDRLNDASDIDLAVGLDSGLSYNACTDWSRELSLLLEREVSVIDIEKMEGIILQEILVKGITILNRNPNLKAKYLSKMYEYTEDILPFQMSGIHKKVREFLNE